MSRSEPSSLTALVVDDEKLAREGLAMRLKALGYVDILRQCENGRAALRAIAECEPDVVFLDIQMPGISGFDLVSQMQGDAMPIVVFVTAFDAFAVDAFQVHAVDYLLKPVEQERLEAAVNRCFERRAEQAA
ncbi:MAG: response regulator, partial [Pseudomonadota bacterium]|nr:response regulator [Pseudomonadota bacterium]